MSYFEFLIKLLCKEKIYKTVLTVVLGIILYKIIIIILHNFLIKGKDGFEKKRRMTIFNLMRNIITYSIYIIILLVLLSIFGVNVTSILASLGILSAVLGLALQDTIKDFINGIAIIADNFFVVGDTIKYKEFQGEVISLGFRTTKIREASGKVMIIANRNISEVVNLSQHKASLFIHIPISYESKKQEVEKVLMKLIEKLKAEKEIAKAEYLGISSFEDSSIVYMMQVECKAGSRYKVERMINGYIKEEADQSKLDIPYQKIEIINQTK